MLPKNKLVYGTNVESSAARSYRSNIQPMNGTGVYNACLLYTSPSPRD